MTNPLEYFDLARLVDRQGLAAAWEMNPLHDSGPSIKVMSGKAEGLQTRGDGICESLVMKDHDLLGE